MFNPHTAPSFDPSAPIIKGHHAELASGWVNGEISGTITPDIALAVDSLNNWIDESERGELDRTKRFELAAEFLGEILRWLAESNSLSSAGLRAIALVCAVRPDLIKTPGRGKRGSQNGVGKKFGVTRSAVQQRVREVFDLSGGMFTGRNMQMPDARLMSSRRATAVHKKLGHVLHPKKNAKL